MYKDTVIRSILTAFVILFSGYTLYAQDAVLHKVLLATEGDFNQTEARLSVFDFNTKEIENNVFRSANEGLKIGDVLQSIDLYNDKLYLVVNNSHNVWVVNKEDYSIEHNISLELGSSPRQIAFYEDKAFVSLMYGDSVAVVDLNSYEVVDYLDAKPNETIDTPQYPDHVRVFNNSLFIANSGWGADSTVVVYDLPSLEYDTTYNVGFQPFGMTVDSEYNLWVLAKGTPDYSNYPDIGYINFPSLTKIDLTSKKVIETIELDEGVQEDIIYEPTTNSLYIYKNSGISKYSLETNEFTTLESTQQNAAYSFNITVGSVNPQLFVTAGAFKEDGSSDGSILYVYDLDGTLMNSYAFEGKYPGDIEFDYMIKTDVDTEQRPNSSLLAQNYPNPFNPTTTIHYSLKSASEVRLEVFNTMGQKVGVLVNSKQAAGDYQVQFNASYLSSGVYYYSLSSNGFTQTKKMILIK